MAKKKKDKKDKPRPNLKPEFVLDPATLPPAKPKKKHAPDRPQPAWLFPPVKDNPYLNPKAKSEAKKVEEKADHDAAIKFLQYRTVTTPIKKPPPPLLLTLVGTFLTSYGFNSASRIYQTELASRRKLEEWEVILDEKLPPKYPDLVKIFREQHKSYEIHLRNDDTTSSESGSEGDNEASKKKAPRPAKVKRIKVAQQADEDSDNGNVEGTGAGPDSDDFKGSRFDIDMKEDPLLPKAAHVQEDADEESSQDSSSPETSSSDTGDELELTKDQVVTTNSDDGPTLRDIVKNLGKDVNSDTKPTYQILPADKLSSPERMKEASETSTSSDSDEEGEDIAQAITEKAAVAITTQEDSTSTDASSSSAESDSESEREASSTKKTVVETKASGTTATRGQSDSGSDSDSVPKIHKTIASSITSKIKDTRTGSSSSETLQATPKQRPSTTNTSLSSTAVTSDASANDPVHKPSSRREKDSGRSKRKRSPAAVAPEEDPEPVSKKQQRSIARNEPFQRVPKDTAVDARFSNKYKSYDYAEQAHYDLSVTKGKGFTKEKNKKKRGSYRGGAIDIGGGRAVKFDE